MISTVLRITIKLHMQTIRLIFPVCFVAVKSVAITLLRVNFAYVKIFAYPIIDHERIILLIKISTRVSKYLKQVHDVITYNIVFFET